MAVAAAPVFAAVPYAAVGTDVGLAATVAVSVLLESARLELYLMGPGVNGVQHVLVGLSVWNDNQIGCIRLSDRHIDDWHTQYAGLQCSRVMAHQVAGFDCL